MTLILALLGCMKTVVLEEVDHTGPIEEVDVGPAASPTCSATVRRHWGQVQVQVQAQQARSVELRETIERYRVDRKEAPVDPDLATGTGVAMLLGGGLALGTGFAFEADRLARVGFWTGVGSVVPFTVLWVWTSRDGQKSAPYGHVQDQQLLKSETRAAPWAGEVRVVDGGLLLGQAVADEEGVALVVLDRAERASGYEVDVEVGAGSCRLDLSRTALTAHLHEEELLAWLASGDQEQLERARGELVSFGEETGRAWEAWCELEGRQAVARGRAGDWEDVGLLASIPEGHCGNLQAQARQAWRKQVRSALSAYRLDEARDLWAYGSGLVDMDESERIREQIDAAVPKSWPTRIRRAERVCSAYATEVYARRQRAYAAQRLGADALDAEVAEFEAWIAEQEAGELGEVLADAQRMMREMEDWTYSSGQNTDDLRLELAMTLRSACP